MSSELAKLHLFADTGLAVCPLEGLLLRLSRSQLLGTVQLCRQSGYWRCAACLLELQLKALAAVVDTGATVPIWKEAD